jgi:hypothetical protein
MLSTSRIDMPATVLFNVASMYNTMGSDVTNDTIVALLENFPKLGQRWQQYGNLMDCGL